mgnify:CR=1 FL=1
MYPSSRHALNAARTSPRGSHEGTPDGRGEHGTRQGRVAGGAATLDELLESASRMAAETLEVSHFKVLEWRPDTEDFVVRAGVGWHEGVVGSEHAEVPEPVMEGSKFRS